MLSRWIGAVSAAILIPLPSAPFQPDGNECLVLDGQGICLVTAGDPGRPGRPTKDRTRKPSPTAERQPAPASPAPTPDPGIIVATGAAPGAVQNVDIPIIPGPAAPAGPAPPDPQVLAQQAVNNLALSPPEIRTSTTDTGFVGVPIWFWTDNGEQYTKPASATAVAGPSRVTATAHLTAIEWEPGPPGVRLRCTGPGTPWTGQAGPSPDCGYTFQLRSLPERTNGTGRWTITATSVWQVDWTGTSAGVPVTGTQTVRVSAGTTLAVGEIQVLVTGD